MCAPAQTQIIEYDVTKHWRTHKHACIITHTHLQDLSVSFQIEMFCK